MIFSKSFFQKHKKWSGFLNFGWIRLVNELSLTFSALTKCAQAQFNVIIEAVHAITGRTLGKPEKYCDVTL